MIVEKQAMIDLYLVIARWMIALNYDAPSPPPEIVAQRLRQEPCPEMERLLLAASAVTRYVADQILDSQGLKNPTTNEIGHA